MTLYLVTVLIWGSTWIAINFQLGEVPLTQSVFYRYAIAATVLLGWCVLRRRRLRYTAADHRLFAGMGLLMFGLNYLAAYAAQLYISSAFNALVFSCLVWMNILNAWFFLGVRSPARVFVGAGLGMAGLVVLLGPEISHLKWGDRMITGGLISLGGAFSASLGNVLAQHAQQRGLPVVQCNAWGMAWGTALLGVVCLVQGEPWRFDPGAAYVGSLLYLALFGSVAGFLAYLTLIGRIGAHRAGYVVVAFPLVATLLAVLFEGLALTPAMGLAVALIGAGNALILYRSGSGRDSGAAGSQVLRSDRASIGSEDEPEHAA